VEVLREDGRNPSTGTHRRTNLTLRTPEMPMIAKDFIIAKTFRAHSANFFRQDKSLRVNWDELVCSM
jgi:hypothetical protein